MTRTSYIPLLLCIPATTDIFCVCTVSLSKQMWNRHCQCFYSTTHCQPEPFEIRSYLKESSRHGNSPACFGDKSRSSGRYNTKAYKTKWWPNIISNKDLWKATGQEDINLEIRKRKFRWIGHTLRKEDGEIPKATLHWNPQGNRKRGRPKNSWRRSVVKEAGRSWNELRFLAADRQKWKRIIDNLCS